MGVPHANAHGVLDPDTPSAESRATFDSPRHVFSVVIPRLSRFQLPIRHAHWVKHRHDLRRNLFFRLQSRSECDRTRRYAARRSIPRPNPRGPAARREPLPATCLVSDTYAVLREELGLA